MNKNKTLKWIENEMKNKILIDDDILCFKSAIIGIYGIFIVRGTTEICAYVGRSANIYQRFLIGNKAHLVKLKNGVYDNTAIKEAIADSDAKISVRILEKVPFMYDNYNKDIQKLASRECYYIDKYQNLEQCLEQRPDGSNMKKSVWMIEKKTTA